MSGPDLMEALKVSLHPAPFPIQIGDSVTFCSSTGFVTGEFTTWDRKGRAVLRVPEYDGRTVRIAPELLRPCNDKHMVTKRGHIPWPKPTPRPKEASKR